ncbi:MAG: ribosome maturation factor RimP [Clostridia bacterium]|nr:ribosome maturation factor RimP [Clostridia bacterium]
MKKQGNTVQAVQKIAEPIAEELGLQIWDVRFVKEGASWFLRIFIDKEDGVNIEDCEAFSRAIDPILDEKDVVEQSYCLEVSSPGLERELTRDEHFERFIGSDVLVKLIRPIEGIGRELDGVLAAADKDTFELADADDNRVTINKKDTVWVKLDDFNM